jgi:hypothetical protein
VTAPLTADDSIPVVYFHDAANPKQIDGVTWHGVVGVGIGVPDYHAANPSATLFGGNATEIRDRVGAIVDRGSFGAKSFTATWADDDVHYCLIEPFDFLGADGVPATLNVGSAQGGIQKIAQVGKIYEQVSTYVASCSIASDRAVVVQSGGQGVGVAAYWVVQLSTGKVLWTHDFVSATMPMSLVASHDSHYIAENTNTTSTIYSADGSKVTQFNASVAGFSWDGSTVVLASSQSPEPAKVVTLGSGKTIWTAPVGSGNYVWKAIAEPNGGGLAIAVANSKSPGTAATAGYPPVDLYLIAANGTVITTLRSIYW